MDCEFKFEVDPDPMFLPSGQEHPHLRCRLIISEIMLLDDYIPPKSSVEWIVNLNLKLIQILRFRPPDRNILISDVG
jgi:hypothetical protein